MNIIPITSLKQLQQDIEYLLFQGKREDCEKALHEHYPHYDPGVGYWYETSKYLFVPANYNGGAKAAAK
jgi:hypothetical protein